MKCSKCPKDKILSIAHNVKNQWHSLMSKDCHTLFCFAIFITGIVYLAGSIISLGWLLDKVFFLYAGDSFMDFFNSIRDASLGLGAYTERHVIYPPMANLFFMLLSYITPAKYNASHWRHRRTWSVYPQNVVLIWAFVIICAALFAWILYKGFDSSRKKKVMLTVCAVFSIPFLNMLERGNIMTLAFLALLCYALSYDSKSRVLRELGLVALAFSVSLKLYPALFAWVLISDKRYREFFRCVIYSAVLLIAPSFAFGGPSCLLIILGNIFGFSTSSSGVIAVISKYSGIPLPVISAIWYTMFFAVVLCYLASAFLFREQRDRWKIWILGCITFLSFPSLCSTYAWALFIIPLIRIFKQGLTGADIKGYFIPVLIPFLFLPISLPHKLTANSVATYLCVFAVAIYAIYDTVRTIRARRQSKNSPVESDAE